MINKNQPYANLSKEEKYHLDITTLCCDYDTYDVNGDKAMKKLMQLNVDFINSSDNNPPSKKQLLCANCIYCNKEIFWIEGPQILTNKGWVCNETCEQNSKYGSVNKSCTYYSKKQEKQLALAYTKGIMDERKEWKEVSKENSLLKSREKSREKGCFCQGDPIWRAVCAECQDWLKKEIKNA